LSRRSTQSVPPSPPTGATAVSVSDACVVFSVATDAEVAPRAVTACVSQSRPSTVITTGPAKLASTLTGSNSGNRNGPGRSAASLAYGDERSPEEARVGSAADVSVLRRIRIGGTVASVFTTTATEVGSFAQPAPTETAAAPSGQITEETPGDSGVEGQVLWADGRPTARQQIFLKGAPKSPNQTLQWVMRTDDNGHFAFKRIPAGTYMLTNKIAGAPTWRLRVTLAPGQTTTLDLSEANSAKVRDDFPGA